MYANSTLSDIVVVNLTSELDATNGAVVVITGGVLSISTGNSPLQTNCVRVTSLKAKTPSAFESSPASNLLPPVAQLIPADSATTSTRALRPLAPFSPLQM